MSLNNLQILKYIVFSCIFPPMWNDWTALDFHWTRCMAKFLQSQCNRLDPPKIYLTAIANSVAIHNQCLNRGITWKQQCHSDLSLNAKTKENKRIAWSLLPNHEGMSLTELSGIDTTGRLKASKQHRKKTRQWYAYYPNVARCPDLYAMSIQYRFEKPA